MIDIKLHIIAILLLISSFAFAQPTRSLKYLSPKQSKNMAKNAEKFGDIYSAIAFYEKYCASKTDDIDALYNLAELYRQSRDYTNALRSYKNVYSAEPDKYPKSLYYLALMQKMTGDYKAAIESFEKFKKEFKIDELKKILKSDIEGCNLAEQLMTNELNVEISHLDTTINKAYIEFAPQLISENKMLYSSLKSDTLIYFDIEEQKKPVRKLYVAENKNNKWTGGKEFEGPFNAENINTGNGTFSPDGKRFYFTRCQTDWQNKVICSIYMSINENGEWQEPKMLENGINNPAYTSTQPTIGSETKKGLEIIYFVSDCPGGKGGMDLWYAYYDIEKNYFKEPKNLGSKINTEGDEITPYFDQNNHTLYFSSNGLPGLGGFDIFKSSGELNKWSQPENIGYPVNSSYDDLYYTITKNRKEAFLTSNRPGVTSLKSPTCCDDIFAIKYLDLFIVKTQGNVFQIKGENDQIDDKYIQSNLSDSSLVSLFLIDDDNTEILLRTDTTNALGEFEFELDREKNYKVVASKDGFFNKSTSLTTKNIPKTKEKIDISPLGIKKISKIPIIIDNIYYEFGKATLTAEATVTIDSTIFRILNETPDIIVEISSHTDSVSSEEYNQKLSQKRAESVVDYLVSKGIEKQRMIAKGYGEAFPIAPNSFPDGRDNEEGRAKNRRTEFKVIGSSNQFSILNRENLNIKKDNK